MFEKQSFDFMYSEFVNLLRKKNKYRHTLHLIDNSMPNKQLVLHVWSLPEFHQCMNIVNSLEQQKCDKHSEDMRKKGNELYAKSKFYTAVTMFSQAVCHGSKSENISLAYANRAAALFEMGFYQSCLLDIQRAFDNNYPVRLHEKLIKRQIKCYTKLGDEPNAFKMCDIFKKKGFSLDAKFIQQLLSKESKSYPDTYSILHRKLFIPSIESINSTIPSASDAIEMTFIPNKGRGFIAKRDIEPGEVLIREKAFASMLNEEYMSTHCSTCLKRSLTPVPCPKCCYVVFCNETCRNQALKSFHEIECCFMKNLINLDMGAGAGKTLRSVTQSKKTKLIKELNELEKTSREQYMSQLLSNTYKSTDLINVYYLETMKHKRSADDLLKNCAAALTFFKLLRLHDNFKSYTTSLTDEELLIASYLLKMMLIIECNSMASGEVALNPRTPHLSEMIDAGSTLYPTATIANHSCYSNISRFCYGSEVIVVAIHYIFKGEEITDAYTPDFEESSKASRQEILDKYFFKCTCKPCLENWPEYQNINPEPTLKCPNCSVPLNMASNSCKNCKIPHLDLKYNKHSVIELFKTMKDYQSKAVNTYKQNCNFVNTSIELKSQLKNYIQFMCKYCTHPSQFFCMAVSNLVLYFNKLGPMSILPEE